MLNRPVHKNGLAHLNTTAGYDSRRNVQRWLGSTIIVIAANQVARLCSARRHKVDRDKLS